MSSAIQRNPVPDTTTDGGDVPQRVRVTFVTAPSCHFCDHATSVLDELAEEFPLIVRTVPLDSTEGRAIVARWGVPFPPVVLVEGNLEGFGRVSARRLRKVLGAARQEAGGT